MTRTVRVVPLTSPKKVVPLKNPVVHLAHSFFIVPFSPFTDILIIFFLIFLLQNNQNYIESLFKIYQNNKISEDKKTTSLLLEIFDFLVIEFPNSKCLLTKL